MTKSPITDNTIKELCDEVKKYNTMQAEDYARFGVKRGLRNSDGTGVMAGITRVCSVEGYYINDGERVPREGVLTFRGYNLAEIIDNCVKEDRFGFEEVVRLLILGDLPTQTQLDDFTRVLSDCRELPEDFVEDMIMKAPSMDIMNKLARSVLALYSYDENPDDTSLENVMRQSIQLIARLPMIMSYAYQVKRRHFYRKSMYLHQLKPHHTTAEAVLNALRSDRKFTPEEAKLLDVCLMLHAEHGGGNNSTFATRVLSSSGTDTYSAIAAGVGALKGPKHGGANIKVSQMVEYIKANVADITDEGAVADYLVKILKKEAGDKSGLVYGMGHAVYTLSDPRAVILKKNAGNFAAGTPFEDEYRLLEIIEKLTPELMLSSRGIDKTVCANVDLYSGLVYKMLGIPFDLFTPIFAVARVAGWSAHRIEELLTGNRIIRPAYKNVNPYNDYVPISERK